MIDVEEITEPERLEALEPEWAELWERRPNATPFQGPEWLIPWWDVFHPGTLRTLALREGGRLIGLAPLYLGDDGVVRFLGAGISDHLDVLYEPGRGEAVASAVLREAGACCDLMELAEDSPLLAAAPPERISQCSVCPVVELPAEPGAGLQRNIRRYGRRLAELDETSYETDSGARCQEYLEALFRLHAAAWRERREPGVLADERVRDFHCLAAPRLAARCRLRMFGLRHAGYLKAVIYGLAARRKVFFYLTGFDPELNRLSPGALLLDFALRESTREGFTAADLLRGQETYKYQWGARERPSFRVR